MNTENNVSVKTEFDTKFINFCIDFSFLFLFLFFAWWQIFSSHYILKWDNLDIYLPWKHYATECVRNARLPLWNPFMNCGFAQMGDPGTWYPVSWFIGWLMRYDMTALKLEFLFHIYLAGFAMYRFSGTLVPLRKIQLIAAISYMSSGFFVSNAQHLGWLVAAAWFPLVFFYLKKLIERPNSNKAIKLSLCSFFMLTGGYPGVVITSFYIFLVYLISRLFQLGAKNSRDQIWELLKSLALFAIVLLLLSSVVLLAYADIRPLINRGAGLDLGNGPKSVLFCYLPIKALLTFVFSAAGACELPKFWGQDFSLINCYAGVLTLLSLFWNLLTSKKGSQVHFMFGLSIFFLMIALANIFPFRAWISHLPLMNLFRFPSLFRIFSIFFLISASVYALQQILTSESDEKQFAKTLLLASLAFFAVAAVDFFFMEKWMFKKLLLEGFETFDTMAKIPERIFLQAILQAGILFSGYSIYLKSKFKFGTILLILVALDLFCSVQMNIRATAVTKGNANATNEAIAKMPKSYPIPSLKPNFITIDDHFLGGTIPNTWLNLAIYHKIPSCEGNSPLSFTLHNQAQQLPSYKASLTHPLLYLKNESAPSCQSIQIKSFSPNSIACELNLKQADQLVYLQNFHPRWIVEVDGKPQEIQLADHAFLSVHLSQGAHKVKFQFQPTKIIVGFYISLITFFLALLYLVLNFIFKNIKISVTDVDE